MKKKFILLAMMLLTLIGGVNLNVLNAQENVVRVGTASTSSAFLPTHINYKHTYSQQIYVAGEDFELDVVNITKLAFKKSGAQTTQRNIKVYMKSIGDKTKFEDDSDWISVSDTDLVYDGVVNYEGSTGSLITISFENDFEYNGGNILLCVQDNTGSYLNSYPKHYVYSTTEDRALSFYNDNVNTPSGQAGKILKTLNYVEFTYIAVDDVVPAAPTNLVATTVDYKSVNLTWDAAENALKYQVWQGENMIAETDKTEYLVEGLSDGTEYCFTVKSVRYNNNTSGASNESCATTAVLPVPGTPVNLAVTNITHISVKLTWDAVEYAESYTVSYTGGTITVTENTCYVTGLTPETNYTFSVTANNTKGSSSAAEVSATTEEDPFPGKFFRIKVMSGSNTGYLNINSNLVPGSYYNYSYVTESQVGVSSKSDYKGQIFTIENDGDGHYYLKSYDGYYIKCDYRNNTYNGNWWSVYAYSSSEKTPLVFEYDDAERFYIRDYDKMTNKSVSGDNNTYTPANSYFKVNSNSLVYCDAAKTIPEVVLWSVEEVALSAAAAAYNSTIFDDETATLSVTAMYGSGNYTYSWSPSEVLNDATSANPTFTLATIGEHTFTCIVTDTESGSTAEASVTVYVNARPALQLAVSADKELIYNDGETAVLTATVTEGTGYAPYTYSWTLNETEVGTEATYTFSNTTVGEYTLTCTVTDARNNTQTASTTIEVKDASERPLEMEIGSNEFGQNNIPLNSYYYAAFSQQIYTSDQIGQSGCIINDISFYRTENVGLNNRNIEIYLLNTDKSKFDNSNDWVKLSENDKVYANSSYTNDGLGWFTFTLDTPFEYTGGNLLVCMRVIRKGNNYTMYDKYAAFNTENSRALYRANDDDTYDISNITQTGTLLNQLNHIKFGYELIPQNLVATPAQIHVGETTILTWDAFDGAASYNVYVNSELNGSTTGTSYELSGLAYNMNPGHKIEVVALNENGDVISGKASVTVQVAGTFTLTVNVTDGTKPIEGATVEIDMTSAYDEFFNKLEMEVEPAITNEYGVANITLPLLAKNYDYYGGMWLTPLYTVKASKTPYSDNESDVYCTYISNLQTVERTLVLTLPMVNNIQVQDEKGEYLYDVMEGTNVVLSWDAVEGADAYKVYKLNAGEVDSFETVTGTTDTIEGVLKGYQYAVSALFGELESEKSYASLQVKGIGYFIGYVTDGINALQGIQVKVSSEYGDASAVATTNEEGYFNGEIMEGNYYVLTISHSDYEEFTSETFAIIYEQESDFGTVTLTAKPSASDITEVTATLNGENVDVEWTVTEPSTYTKYNVYRRLAGTQGKGDNIATVTTTSTTDTEWETLEPGTYQYGVAALLGGGSETIYTDDFSSNKGWTGSSNWTVSGNVLSIYSNSAGFTRDFTSPSFVIGDNAPIIQFDYTNNNYNVINISLETSSSSIILGTIEGGSSGTFTSSPVDMEHFGVNVLNSEVKIKFSCSTGTYSSTSIDNLKVYSESPAITTQIVWSDEVVKQGPNTFEGTVSTVWNVAENWSNGVVPATGDEVIVNAEAVISGNVELSTLDIVGNGSVTVDANASLTVTGAITQEKYYSLIMNDGAQVFQNNNANVTAQFNMNLVNPSGWSTSNKDGWQFISSPLSNVNVTNIAEGNYDLYKYDGEKENEWLNHKDVNFADDTYQHHIGYLASHETKTTLEFKGTLNYNDYNGSYAFYDFVEYYENEPLKNFYLIGNPYPFNISWADFKNNKGMFNGYAYVKEDGNYEYATSGEIAVGDGFFVQAISGTPDDQYSTLYYYLKGSGNTRSTKESNNSLNITATGNAGEDNVIINLAGKSEGFNKLQNFNDAIATVYVAEDGKNYGIYNCDADVQEVELSFNANKMGNYTISIEPNGKFQTVTLVDRFTGIETNMLVEDYNFTAMSEENTNRFIVRFANGQQTTDNSHFVYQSGEELILNIQGDVQIVDVLGRVVYNGEAMNDINRINVSSFNSGAYMVKVMNGNEVKVEKVVIY